MRSSALLFALLLATAPRAQEPAATVLLRGRVVTWQGQPIAGAAVALARGDRLPTSRLLAEPQTRTDEGGRFELQAPAVPVPDQPLEQLLIAQKGMAAFARAPGFATKGGKTAAQGQPTARAPVTELGDLVLADGVRLFGRVRDPQGKPLAGARILARDMLDQHRVLPGPRLDHLCHAVSNDSGIFELPCTLAQALSLDVSLPGHLRSAIEPVAVGAPLEIMLAPSGSIRGRVLDQDGRGVPGATVQANYERRGPVTNARTEPDGSFELPLEYAARYRLTATLRVGSAQRRQGQSEVLEGGQANLELLLAAAAEQAAEARLPVKAVDRRTRTPLPRFRVAAVFEDYANRNSNYLEYRFEQSLSPEQDAEGGVLTAPAPSKNNVTLGAVRVVASGYAPATVRDVEWKEPEPGASPAPLVVELLPEATIAGRVVDEQTRAPIAGARVWARPRLDPAQGVFAQKPDQPPDDAVTAGDDGSFTLARLGEGNWQLYCRHPERPGTPPRTCELTAEQQQTGVELELPAGAEVSGHIRGMTIPQGCRVSLHELPPMNFGAQQVRYIGTQPTPESQVQVGADGAFVFRGVKLASFMLVLELPSPPRCGGPMYVPLEPFRVRKDGLRRDFDVLGDQPGRIEGRVSFPRASVPLERLLVVAQPVAEDPTQTPVMFASAAIPGPRTFLGADGRYSVRVGPGHHRLYLVDLLTGIALCIGADAVRVGADERKELDLAAALTEVRVTLEPENEGGAAALVDRLEVRFTPKSAGGKAVVVGNDNYDAGVGIAVPPATTLLTLALPEGSAMLLLRNNVSQVRVDNNRYNVPPLGRAEVEVGKEPAIETTLKVGAPPEIPPAEDARKDAQGDAIK